MNNNNTNTNFFASNNSDKNKFSSSAVSVSIMWICLSCLFSDLKREAATDWRNRTCLTADLGNFRRLLLMLFNLWLHFTRDSKSCGVFPKLVEVA